MRSNTLKSCILALILLQGLCVHSQIIKNPDSKVVTDRSKAILMIMPCRSGSFYLNDYFLTDVAGNDTVYINNLNPGNYNLKFQTDSNSYQQVIWLKSGNVASVSPCKDSLNLRMFGKIPYETISKMTGKKTFALHKNRFYNVSQFAILNAEMKDMEGSPVNSLTAITTINGYQIFPAFCAGLGITYNHYPYHFVSVGWDFEPMDDGTLNFMPVFLDIRAHLPPTPSSVTGKVIPFIKFDIGYNILLKQKDIDYMYAYNSSENSFTIAMNKGGVYVSPGFGLRIFLTDLVQLTASVEYSFEKSQVEFIHAEDYSYLMTGHYNFNFFRICLGVAFQYK
jgi:hypothetical protein